VLECAIENAHPDQPHEAENVIIRRETAEKDGQDEMHETASTRHKVTSQTPENCIGDDMRFGAVRWAELPRRRTLLCAR